MESVTAHDQRTHRIEAALPTDARALHDVAAATFPLACPPSARIGDIRRFIAENLSVASFERYLADPARSLLVAPATLEWAPRPPERFLMGYTMLIHGSPSDPDVAAVVGTEADGVRITELSKCYVRAEAHGGGTAAHLMRESIAVAAARGATRLWLGVNEENARAHRFYEKSGFTRVGTKRFQVGERLEHDYVYLLEL